MRAKLEQERKPRTVRKHAPTPVTSSRSALHERYLIRKKTGKPFSVRVKPLERGDITKRNLKEWRKGRVIKESDLQRYVARQVTLTMKSGVRILGIVNVREPLDESSDSLPEVVALETNPEVRDGVRGVGTGLMAAAVLVSKDWGYGGGVQLTADQNAVSFYRKLGMNRRRGSSSENDYHFTPRKANEFLREYERFLRTSFNQPVHTAAG